MSSRIAAVLLSSLVLFACGTEAEPDHSQGRTVSEAPAPVVEPVVDPVPEPEPDLKPAAAKEESGPNIKKPETFTATAPDEFSVKFETTKGDITILVHRAWSPLGVDRLYNMVEAGYFVETSFFRVIQGYIAQFGLHADPNISDPWLNATIKDEPVLQGNLRGRLTFAMGGPNSRSVQFFINMRDSSRLDSMGFGAIGEVTAGMDVVDSLFSGYGDKPPTGPDQSRVMFEGNTYLKQDFPKLDFIKSATIVK